jgi:hypothetical protein
MEVGGHLNTPQDGRRGGHHSRYERDGKDKYWGSDDGEDVDVDLLGCNAVWTCK